MIIGSGALQGQGKVRQPNLRERTVRSGKSNEEKTVRAQLRGNFHVFLYLVNLPTYLRFPESG